MNPLLAKQPLKKNDQRSRHYIVIASITERYIIKMSPIGSFPQTDSIRLARQAFKQGKLSANDYTDAMHSEIRHAVQVQERLGLDVLVHGEAERNDMVEYFAEQLDGYLFTRFGWVQSCGSR